METIKPGVRTRRENARLRMDDRPKRRRFRNDLLVEPLEGKILLSAFPTPLQPQAPIGSLIYEGSVVGTIGTPTATNTYTLSVDAGQTISLVAHPSNPYFKPTVSLISQNNVLASGTAKASGDDAVIQPVTVSTLTKYTFSVGGKSGTIGEYTLTAILNSAVEAEDHSGPTNNTLATAQPLDISSVPIGGGNDRLAVLGTIVGGPAVGDPYVSARTSSGGLIYRLDQATGAVNQTINSPEFSKGVISGVKLGPDNLLYVALTTSFNATSVSGELVVIDLKGNTIGTIPLPDDPADNFFYHPYGFDVAADDTFWIPEPNSGNIAHVAHDGSLIQRYPVSAIPETAAISPTGDVISTDANTPSALFDLNPTSGVVTTISLPVSVGGPAGLNFDASGNLWLADFYGAIDEFSPSYNLIQQIFTPTGPNDVEASPDGTVWSPGGSVLHYDAKGNLLTNTGVNGSAIFVTVLGAEYRLKTPLPTPDKVDNYSLKLTAGETLTAVATGLNQEPLQLTLEDASGKVLVTGSAAPSSIDSSFHNFVAPATGRYYLVVNGTDSAHYSLIATRGADFGDQASVTTQAGQDITATLAGGNGGALGVVQGHSPASLSTSFDGIDFKGSSGQFLPPDTIAAAGDQYIVEAVNVGLRVTDKSGNDKLDESLTKLFAPLGIAPNASVTDPYVVFDDSAHRFYLSLLTFDSTGGAFLFAVSNDSNPLDGFTEHRFNVGALGGTGLDFDKLGYNADGVFLTANDFNTAAVTPVVVAIQKSTILRGAASTFVSYVSTPPGVGFGTFVPAQMHGATPGLPEYFVSEAGYENGHAARVATLTNFLSGSPTWVITDIPVNAYLAPPTADQPGAPGSVVTNDTTFTQADWRLGKITTAQTVGEPDDGGATSRVRWYQFSTLGAAPVLIQQGTVHPGPGVDTYFGSIVQDAAGDLGMTYMESSLSENVSMYVAAQIAGSPAGSMGPGLVAAAGLGYMPDSFREGDYSGISVDPADGKTFWAANEYIGADGSNDIWRTHIASFQANFGIDANYYAVRLNAGDKLTIDLDVPGSGTGQFVNNFVPFVTVFDPNGNPVTSKSGLNIDFSITVPKNGGGRYTIRIGSSSKTPTVTAGEYTLTIYDVPETKAAAAAATSVVPALVAAAIPNVVTSPASSPTALSKAASTTDPLAGHSGLPDVTALYNVHEGSIVASPSLLNPVPTGRRPWSIFESKKPLPN
jgi:sugar lactone lactonase YvrE